MAKFPSFPPKFGAHLATLNAGEREEEVVKNLLLRYFKIKWFKDFVMPGGTGPQNYLRYRRDGGNYGVVRNRLQPLAEDLWNIENFCDFHSGLLLREKLRVDPTEGHVAEVSFAACLVRMGVKFRIIATSTGLTSDYVITMPTGTEVYTEVKCRKTDSQFGIDSVASRLKKAAKKLPEGRPGFVALQIPPSYATTKVSDMTASVDKLFRAHSRVAAIKLFARIVTPVPDSTNTRVTFHWREEPNPYSEFGALEDWRIVRDFRSDWTTIAQIVEHCTNA